MSDLEHSPTVLARSWQSGDEIGVSAGAPCTTELVELVREAGVSVLLESDRSIHYMSVTATSLLPEQTAGPWGRHCFTVGQGGTGTGGRATSGVKGSS